MNSETAILMSTALYFLALVNPASKIFLLSSINPPISQKKLMEISFQSTGVAFLILLLVTVVGSFVLKSVFHVEIYSLKVAGGIILFIIGLQAVRNGRFYESSLHGSLSDISVVPLGAPLIAGPGTITAAISYSSSFGVEHTVIALIFALIINLMMMLGSAWIATFLNRFYAIGPMIRITGLIVAAVAVQMMLDGVGDWYSNYQIGHLEALKKAM
ncbi:MAG TPA: MarC family protein [Lentisphaeria bacterium]|nr:MAG: hypothetical protein A2X45_11555 [Lentisphaerae bacterium GWF2_50_93]HCE44023.1 MarC family protein [Lentisphaeria bacterium]